MLESLVLPAAGVMKGQGSPGKLLETTNLEVWTCQVSFKQAILYLKYLFSLHVMECPDIALF